MGQTIMLTGIVLEAAPVGEYDKRIKLLTKERGKITAFARGARRQGSQLLAAASPLVFGTFEAYEGRSAYTVVKASVFNYFRDLNNDLEGIYYGFYFLEIADYYASENIEEVHMLKLLYQSLRALEKASIHNRLVRCIYELKAMVINGEYPNVFSCMGCKKTSDLLWFDSAIGGTLCSACRSSKARVLAAATHYTMQYIITSPIEKLYTFTVSDQVLESLEQIMKEYMSRYIDRSFKSMEVLEKNKGFAEYLS